jgi:hypothetical protein
LTSGSDSKNTAHRVIIDESDELSKRALEGKLHNADKVS